jgi:hypothetical protein
LKHHTRKAYRRFNKKNQADYAVTWGKAVIQNAHDLYDFCVENLQTLKQTSTTCNRRIFRYVQDINRSRGRLFKSVPAVRSVHQVKSVSQCKIFVICAHCPEKGNLCNSQAGPYQPYDLAQENKEEAEKIQIRM